MRAFADFGNTPGSMFPVNGNPREIVYYQDVAVIPDLTNLKLRLENTIRDITGVDQAYRGRMTNSVQTTELLKHSKRVYRCSQITHVSHNLKNSQKT